MNHPVPPEHAADLAANGRAVTPEAKRAVIERILAAWEKVPARRLGQLLMRAGEMEDPLMPLRFVEDERLAGNVEKYVEGQ